jgi:predicted kinase
MALLFLVQMSGVPGAGKSTLAREIGRRIPAAVLDHDVIKNTLIEQGLSFEGAGRISYSISREMARSLLGQEMSVVLDSPCYYPQILDAGLEMAAAAGACYRYVECVNEDLEEIGRRLRARTPLRTQWGGLDLPPAGRGGDKEGISGVELFREWMLNMKRPEHSYLRVDTSRPLAECLAEVFAFLEECAEERAPAGPGGAERERWTTG